jgi:hypothetical protein
LYSQSTESVANSIEAINCVFITTGIEFAVPVEEDKYDGLVDGKELHITQLSDPNNQDDWKMKWSFMKIEQLDRSCDDREYYTTFLDNFNGDELNADNWITGYRDAYPYNFTLNEDNATSLSLPEFVTVEGGLLRLRMGVNNTGVNTVAFPRENEPDFEVTFANGTGAITTNTQRDFVSAELKGGCFSTGRYTVRAKAMPVNKDETTVSAVWFYGWPGEVDLYEQCLSDDCNVHKATFHQWSVDDGNLAQHYDLLLRSSNAGGNGEHMYYQERIKDNGKYGGKFVEYQLEWTPYEMNIRYDNKTIFSFYKYYSLGADGCGRVPLSCDQILSGVPLDDVWEISTWNRWREHFMDLIISTGIPDPNTPFGEDQFFEVDWVRFEHKTDNAAIQGPALLCAEDIRDAEYSMVSDDVIEGPLGWSFLEEGVVPASGLGQNPLKIWAIDEKLSEINIQVTTGNKLSCMDYNTFRTIQVGPPAVGEFRVESRGCGGVVIHGDYPFDIGDYSWGIIPTDTNIPLTISTGGDWVSVFENSPKLNGGFGFRYLLTLTNDCGQNQQEGFHWVPSCKEYSIRPLVNPFSKDIRYIVYEDDVTADFGVDLSISLSDSNGNIVATHSSHGSGVINTANIQSGTYYLTTVIPGTGEVISTTVLKN